MRSEALVDKTNGDVIAIEDVQGAKPKEAVSALASVSLSAIFLVDL